MGVGTVLEGTSYSLHCSVTGVAHTWTITRAFCSGYIIYPKRKLKQKNRPDFPASPNDLLKPSIRKAEVGLRGQFQDVIIFHARKTPPRIGITYRHTWYWSPLPPPAVLYFFLVGALFCIEKAKLCPVFGHFGPFWAILARIYALFGAFFTGPTARWCPKIDKYQIYTLQGGFLTVPQDFQYQNEKQVAANQD